MFEEAIVFDIEADGLDPSVIHCWSANTPEGNSWGLGATGIQENLAVPGNTLVAHNGIGYDYPVLKRLAGVDFTGVTLLDSVVLSRLACPDREPPRNAPPSVRKKTHSLEAWGYRLGEHKQEHEDWSKWTPQMQRRCDSDTRINRALLCELEKELEGFSWESIELEHEVAWIIQEQITNGWLLDQEKCWKLLGELKSRMWEVEAEVHERFHPLITPVKGMKDPLKSVVVPKVKANGDLSKVGLNWLGDSWKNAGGPFTKIMHQEFNLGSRQQIGRWLEYFGWTPQEFTDGGQPIVDEETLETVDIPEGKLIAEYLMLEKRIAMVQSWLDAVGPDGRVHGYVNSCGAVTNRMTHSGPNMAQVTANGKPYGREMRECWIVPQGYKLVGMDADALELVCLAHYMNDAAYIKAVSEGNKEDGTDVHTINQRAIGLDTRDQAKTFIYAFLYGAGNAKIGLIVGRSAQVGAKLKREFLRRTPALADLKERVEGAAGRGWLRGLDGRRIHVRSRHAALNTLLQGAGAILMKKALVILYREAKEAGLEFKLVGNIHDEVQAEVLEEHAEAFGEIAAAAVSKAGKELGLRCPASGSYKVGNNWAETH